VGVVGQITPWKGQLEAIEALAALRRRGVAARLLVVGAPTFVDDATRYDNRRYLDRLRQTIADLGVSDGIDMLGQREDVPKILRALDVLVAPSREEPLGRVVLEGMAMELAVVATDAGGPRELIESGRQGVLVPPKNPMALATAVEDLSRDTNLRRSMGKAARARVLERFSVEAHVRRLLGIYERISSP
jgi:glycosyltransferase involved in cell wall biosynthesis